MRIGIITYYDVTNYGAVLQAYAMQEHLKILGHEAIFLQYYRPRFHVSSSPSVFQRVKRLVSPRAIHARRQEEKKVQSVKRFREQHLVIGKNYDAEEGLDCILVGSDQIFDCKYEFNPYQYAIGAKCERLISYAPSFGEFSVESLNEFEHFTELESAINNFSAHSCRDENTKKVLKKLTGTMPVRVLDPTLLYGFENEKKIWNQRIVKENYLLVYTWGGETTSAKFKDAVCSLAKKHNLKTVSVGDYRPWCNYSFADASPDVFFALVKNSSAVITNMFHGTCFSIINEKPFYSVVMPHNQNKLRDLLTFINLESQIVTDVMEIAELEIPEINYRAVNCFLNKQREISAKFCKESIER